MGEDIVSSFTLSSSLVKLLDISNDDSYSYDDSNDLYNESNTIETLVDKISQIEHSNTRKNKERLTIISDILTLYTEIYEKLPKDTEIPFKHRNNFKIFKSKFSNIDETYIKNKNAFDNQQKSRKAKVLLNQMSLNLLEKYNNVH